MYVHKTTREETPKEKSKTRYLILHKMFGLKVHRIVGGKEGNAGVSPQRKKRTDFTKNCGARMNLLRSDSIFNYAVAVRWSTVSGRRRRLIFDFVLRFVVGRQVAGVCVAFLDVKGS